MALVLHFRLNQQVVTLSGWDGCSRVVVVSSVVNNSLMDGIEDNRIMPDPIAYLITWPTYGTWLPGDQRGWIDYRHGWQLPCRNLEQHCLSRMTEPQCLLSSAERKIVEVQVAETCDFRGWILYAVQCRSNHAHLVIGAIDTNPKKIRADIKAWCTRRLKEKSNSRRQNWWAERGSIRYVWNQSSLDNVLIYVVESQDQKHREI